MGVRVLLVGAKARRRDFAHEDATAALMASSASMNPQQRQRCHVVSRIYGVSRTDGVNGCTASAS